MPSSEVGLPLAAQKCPLTVVRRLRARRDLPRRAKFSIPILAFRGFGRRTLLGWVGRKGGSDHVGDGIESVTNQVGLDAF